MAVQRHRTLLGLTQAIERDIKRRVLSVEESVALTADEVYQEGHKRLSGITKARTLRKMGHPYGRGFVAKNGTLRGTYTKRGGFKYKIHGLPINVQSGRLRSAWRKSREGTRIIIMFQRPPSYGKFVLAKGGTKKMRARGFQQDMDKVVKAAKLGLRRGLKRG